MLCCAFSWIRMWMLMLLAQFVLKVRISLLVGNNNKLWDLIRKYSDFKQTEHFCHNQLPQNLH